MIAAVLLVTPLLAAALSIGESYQGEGTYYGAGQDSRGACGGRGLPTGPGGLMTVALNGPQSGSGNGPCGQCVEGKGTGVGAGGNPIGRFFGEWFVFCVSVHDGGCPTARSWRDAGRGFVSESDRSGS